jgi:hypothetical protein
VKGTFVFSRLLFSLDVAQADADGEAYCSVRERRQYRLSWIRTKPSKAPLANAAELAQNGNNLS